MHQNSPEPVTLQFAIIPVQILKGPLNSPMERAERSRWPGQAPSFLRSEGEPLTFCFCLNAMSSSVITFSPFLGALRGFALPPSRPGMLSDCWEAQGVDPSFLHWMTL
jgi:hypothetical protein